MPTITAAGTPPFREANFNRGWGASPGSALIIFPGQVTAYQPGDEVVVNLGGATFHGVVTAYDPNASGLNGWETRVEIADNRLRLQWDSVKCSWNHTEIRADNPETPGIDRQRRYWSIKSDDHTAQVKTYTDGPFTAAQIIADMLGDLDVAFGWEIDDPDELLDAEVLEIDANNGAKLGQVLTEICNQLGIIFTVVGYQTLVFARKGVGDDPYVDPVQVEAHSAGSALSHCDTHITVVGGRNLYQDCEVTLEPWWHVHYELFVRETDWLNEVESVWGAEWAAKPDDQKAAYRSLKAMSVTLRDYVKATDEHAGENLYADFGMWGEVSRMEIPVWTYLHDIVYKAYRVPRDYTLTVPVAGGSAVLGVDSLELQDHLLGEVEGDDVGNITLRVYPDRVWYPDIAAFVLVQGFNVGAVDPRMTKVITPEQLANAREKWGPNNRFTMDRRPESLGIIFAEQQFKDSEGAPLYEFPNRDKDGIGTDHVLYNVCVPNGSVSNAAAAVKAALCWAGDKYLKKFGSGPRWGTANADGIAKHCIVQEHVVVEQVPWPHAEEDPEEFADDKAAAFVAKLLGQQASYDNGSIRRVGGAGTALTGMIDSVQVQVLPLSPDGRGGGLIETIRLAKERTPVTYFNARTLERLSGQHDLFRGQRALREEVAVMRAQLARKELKRQSPLVSDLQALLATPAGNPSPGAQMLSLTADMVAGAVVWLEAGALNASGNAFGGVIISSGGTIAGMNPVATQGIVPVQVKGPFSEGDSVGANGDAGYAEPDGERGIGRVLAAYSGTETVLAPVQLGGGGGAAARVYLPFECKDMGKHMTESEEPEPDGALFDVREGNLNEDFPEVDGDIESPDGWWSFQLEADVTMFLMLEAALDVTGAVVGRRLFLTDIPESYLTASGDPETGAPPEFAWRRMARLVTDEDFNLTIVQYKKGDQTVAVIISDFTCTTKTRNVVWEKSAA